MAEQTPKPASSLAQNERSPHATAPSRAPIPVPMDDTQPGALTAVDAPDLAARRLAARQRHIPEQPASEAVLRRQLAQQAARIEALEQTLAHVQSQTQALRAAAAQKPDPSLMGTLSQRALRAVRRQVFSFALQPVQDVARLGDARHTFRCEGTKPQFALSTQAARLPSAWVKIRVRLAPQDGVMMNLRVYLNTGAGFSAADSFALPMPYNAQGDIEDLRCLPAQLQELRVEVINSSGKGTFVLSSLSIQELSKQEALAEMLVRAAKERAIPPRRWPHTVGKLLHRLSTVGVAGALALLQHRGNQTSQLYADWVQTYDTLSAEDRSAIAAHIDTFAERPRISIVMPVYNPPAAFLKRAIESVQAQLYDNWELCIADDASDLPHVADILDAAAKQDARIKIVRRKTQGHICAASNDALAMATGAFVAFLDHDDELREHALYLLAEAIERHPQAGLLYSDEDKIDTLGQRHDPYFKSAWNPDLLRSQNYINHLACYRTSLVRAVGQLRLGYEGSQDYDLALRVTQKLDAQDIHHIPHVLYLWRAIEGSTAHTPQAKPYTFQAAQRALTDDLARRQQNAVVTQRPDGFFRTRYVLPDTPPLVSILIPTRDQVQLLRQCIESIERKSTYPNFEIIIVDNDSAEDETHRYFQTLSKNERIRVMPYHKVFNYAAINNAAADIARGEVLCLLNNDIEIITSDWLEELVSQALRPEVGAVGAKLYFGNRTLQHAGAILGIGGIAGHSHKHLPGHDPGSFSRANLVQNFSAVTGACLVIRKQTYLRVGGLDEALRVAYNDIDFCLRVGQLGLRHVFTPYAEMFHHESATRGTDATPAQLARASQEHLLMRERWGTLLENDPYYNPNLTLAVEDFSLALPPRAPKPWLRHTASDAA